VTVAKAWKNWGLQPWKSETFTFSTDPELEAKVRDVVGLYLNPPENAIVLSVDEKSQIQALDRTAPILPLRPGIVRGLFYRELHHSASAVDRQDVRSAERIPFGFLRMEGPAVVGDRATPRGVKSLHHQVVRRFRRHLRVPASPR
jgi:hypothetical protein